MCLHESFLGSNSALHVLAMLSHDRGKGSPYKNLDSNLAMSQVTWLFCYRMSFTDGRMERIE